MKTGELRKRFLEFFNDKKHKIFISDSLVPDDPTVLFTSAGMNQFKPYFLGEKKDVQRATSCQKCLRTGDLEEVGRTPYHHTFFEMLGNFSFGDYFKRDAIAFAWEFLTGNLDMDSGKLWVSVYKEDDEAYNIWKDNIGIVESKIVRLGAKTNFWPSNAPADGPNGPCGPCSEIFFDRGIDKGCGKKNCGPDCDCGRFVEIWNLVFTQFNRVGLNQLEELPQKNIDTGMGLERMAAVLQGKYSNFEIDILSPAVNEVRKILNVYSQDKKATSLINAVVDHCRAATFAIADGVYPSNEERGYVIRKIIRKAVWSAYLLERKTAFLYKLPDLYAEFMRDTYPEIKEKEDVVSKVIRTEEEKFLSTLREGKNQLAKIISGLKEKHENLINANDLFCLYDTFGFPLEISKEISCAGGIQVDDKGFEILLKEQQERSRKGSMFDESIFKEKGFIFQGKTVFVGEDTLSVESNIAALLKGNTYVEEISEGEEALLILDKTPFYAESGGQLADKGVINANSGQFRVDEVLKTADITIHKGIVSKGTILKGIAISQVDEKRRYSLMRSHTATHLLQAALRCILGDHVSQQGSLVDEDRLRFDFTHFQALTPAEIDKVEKFVNDLVLKGIKVNKEIITLATAKQRHALAFFKDKYEDKVRMVSVSDYSKELCAGTHLNVTSEIGLFVIVSESSISSGIRRIEAVVGEKAYCSFSGMKSDLAILAEMFKCKRQEVRNSVIRLQKDWKSEREKVNSLEQKMIFWESEQLFQYIKETRGSKYLLYAFKNKDKDALLYFSDLLRKKAGSLFLFLLSSGDDKNTFICAATGDFLEKGFSPKKFVSVFGEKLSLKGGGKENLIQGIVAPHITEDFLHRVEESLNKFFAN